MSLLEQRCAYGHIFDVQVSEMCLTWLFVFEKVGHDYKSTSTRIEFVNNFVTNHYNIPVSLRVLCVCVCVCVCVHSCT